jgi:DmsE family decaheme c-type cytochrome
MHTTVRTIACGLVSVVIASAWGLMARPSLADPMGQEAVPQADQPGYVGSDTCLMCHEDMRPYGAHARAWDPRSPAAAHGCETCHGPGEKHVEAGGDATLIRTFHALAPREVGDTCTSCHNRADHAFWPGSAHDGRNLSCTTCHSVHDPKSVQGQLTKGSQVELCSQCHRQQAAKLDRSGHMPVREGKMQCSSCHNPHGSMNVRLLRAGHSVAESCTTCHTDKRGPFLFEHAPVRENCASCHDPHGSQHERMLVAKQPMLCQRCHIHTRHPSTIYDNAVVGTSNRIFARSCVTCHSNIHGSNHPSGVTFLR